MSETIGIPDKGGILQSDFIVAPKREILGVSGNKIILNISEKEIEILPKNNDFSYFRARVEKEEMTVSVRTIDKKRNKHPDLYAKELVLKSYQFFLDKGQKIEKIRTNFLEDSDNFIQFYNCFNSLKNVNIELKEREKLAVSETWSGKVYQGLGFSNIVHVGRGRREKTAPEEIWVIIAK